MKRCIVGRTDRRAKHTSKRGGRSRPSVFRRRLFLAAILTGCTLPGMTFAQGPVGGNVVAGAGTIDRSVSNLTNVTTTTNRAVIDWNDFSVGHGHTVNFDQMSSSAAVLNRVTGSAPQSLINGAITSNGNVFISNASGVVIGSTGVINTNGFTATTLDISNERFMNGDLSFSGGSNSAIINNGLISTGNGGANLIASQVINNGTIESTGNINLATGGQLKMAGGRYIQADLDTISGGISSGASLIQNSGTIRAIGGLNVGGEVYLINPNGSIINDASIVAALSNPDATRSGGHVEMVASGNTSLNNASIDTSGVEGGRVVITGESVDVVSSNIDASGEMGGGEVRIGGGWKGQDASIANATTTTISADTQISVDSTGAGDAGSVVVWADQTTEFRGQINAGALGSGDGGQAEVSGKQDLLFTGNVNLLASSPDGRHGTLLLDPATFTLDASNADAIRSQWGSGNLVIEADDEININVDLFPTVSLGGDEKVSTDGAKTSLTLREQTGGDGALDITVAAEIRDRRAAGATVEFNAGTGSFTVTEDGTIQSNLGGTSSVTVHANAVDVAGVAFIDTLIATGNASVGIGDTASGTLNLSDQTIGSLNVATIEGSDFDLEMGEAARASSSLLLRGTTVNIDRFSGRGLQIEADDLTITGPVDGSGTFRFLGQANRTIGLGSGSGDLQFSKSILAGITGFSSFDIGHGTAPGTDISIVDAGLDFDSVTLRGSSIDIDRLSIRSSLRLVTDSLNVQNSLTKALDTGTLRIESITSGRSVGLGDGAAGDLHITADEFSYLGSYDNFDLSIPGSVITVDMDFTGNFVTRISLDAGSGGSIELNEVDVDSQLFRLFSGDLEISHSVTGDSDKTSLELGSAVTRMAVGSATSGNWTLDNTEFAFLSEFKDLKLSNVQNAGLLDIAGVDASDPLDFSTITSGRVSFLSDAMRLSDVSVPKSLDLTVRNGLTFDGGVTTADSTSSLTITAGRVSNGSATPINVGLGTNTTGAVHLDDDEIARITEFDTVHVKHATALPSAMTQVDATFDENLKLSGAIRTEITSLTMTGGSDLDVSTNFKSGGLGNPGADEIVVDNITSDGDISLKSSRVSINGDAHTIDGDVLVDAKIATIGDGTQANHVSIGSAKGTTTVKTGALNVNASGTAGAQIGYAFSGTEKENATGDILVNASGDIHLTGQGANFASIGHGDLLGGDDTGKTVSGDVTVTGSKNVTVEKGHIGHLIDSTGTYASGSTSVFAGMADFNEENENRVPEDSHQPYHLNIDAESTLVSAAFNDNGKLSLFAPSASSYGIDTNATLNGSAAGSIETRYGGPSDPNKGFYGEYVGDAAKNWSWFTSPIGLAVQIIDATSIYGDTITNPATVELLNGDSVPIVSVVPADLGLAALYDEIDENADAGTYTLQIDTEKLKGGYFIRKVYRDGETYGTGPGTPITNKGIHTITPAELVITVDDQTKTYGDLFEWDGTEFKASGLKNDQLIENLLITSSGASESAGVLGGPYDIIGSTPTGTEFKSTNYDITYQNGSLTITPASLDINLLPISKAFGSELDSKTDRFIATGLKNLDKIDYVMLTGEGLPRSAVSGAYELKGSDPFGAKFDAHNYSVQFTEAILTVFTPNDETIHDVWSRHSLYFGTLPTIQNGSKVRVNSTSGGKSSVEVTEPSQDGSQNDPQVD